MPEVTSVPFSALKFCSYDVCMVLAHFKYMVYVQIH